MGAAFRRAVAAAAVLAASAATPARAGPVLAPPLTDGAVVQRDALVTVRGDATPGWPVVVAAGWGSVGVARADADGHFTVTLRTRGPGGPYRVLAWAKSGTIVHDVWVGEVWLCSGQSNMAQTVSESAAGAKTDAVSYPQLHLFTVQPSWSAMPHRTCIGRWTQAEPEAVGAFSATCFFFGRELSSALRIPIGLVAAAIPGSEIEAWTSERGLAAVPELRARLARGAARLEEHEAAVIAWLADFDLYDFGPLGPWFRGETKTSPLDEFAAPAEDGTIVVPAGTVWLRSQVAVPPILLRSSARLELHVRIDGDRAWANGRPLFADRDATGARVYAVPVGALRPTTSLIIRRVTLAPTPLFPLEPARLRVGDQELVPAPWTRRRGLELRHFRPMPRLPAQGHAVLFNAMIAPLVGYPIRGVVWYQGESNVGRAAQYRSTFPALIRDWRTWWGREVPFYFVQLPPFAGYPPTGGIAELRDAQRAALALPATGMVVTTDLSTGDDIHGTDKRRVGERLARWALARTYGRADVVPSGPIFREARVEGDSIRVAFDQVDGGLVATGDSFAGFALAGADRVFHEASAAIDGATVVVRAASVPSPVGVRYGWSDLPVASLANRAGLPASPFRSDDWPGVTDGASWDPDLSARDEVRVDRAVGGLPPATTDP